MYKCGACDGSYSHRTLTPHALVCEEEGGGSVMPHVLGKSKIKQKEIERDKESQTERKRKIDAKEFRDYC